MYFAAKKLGRYQLAESPTTAMVLHSLRMRRSVLMSVVSLIRKVRGCRYAKRRDFTPALLFSALLQFGVPLFFRYFAQLLHCRIKTLVVAAVARQEATKPGHQFGVSRHRNQPGIVDRPGEKAVVAGIAVPRRLQHQVLGLHGCENIGFFLSLFSIRGRTLVQLLKLVPVFQHQSDKSCAALLLQIKSGLFGSATTLRQPTFNAILLDSSGKRLVEHGVSWNVDHLVCEFMEYQPRQFSVRITHHGIQHGIIEPSEGGIGWNPGNKNVQSLSPQIVCKLIGGCLAEIASIANTSGKRKTPLLGRDGKLRRGENVPEGKRALQVRVVPVAAVVGQCQLGGRKFPDAQHQREAFFHWLRRMFVGDDLFDGAAAMPDLHLPFESLIVIAQAGATGKHGCKQHRTNKPRHVLKVPLFKNVHVARPTARDTSMALWLVRSTIDSVAPGTCVSLNITTPSFGPGKLTNNRPSPSETLPAITPTSTPCGTGSRGRRRQSSMVWPSTRRLQLKRPRPCAAALPA